MRWLALGAICGLAVYGLLLTPWFAVSLVGIASALALWRYDRRATAQRDFWRDRRFRS